MVLSKFLSQTLDRITNAFALIAGAMLLFQVISVSLDVILRYFFNAPIPAVISLNEWTLLHIAFFGAAWLQRQGGHVRMDIVADMFGRRGRTAFTLFGLALGIVCCAVLVWFGTDVSWQKFVTKEYDYFKVREVRFTLSTRLFPSAACFFCCSWPGMPGVTSPVLVKLGAAILSCSAILKMWLWAGWAWR